MAYARAPENGKLRTAPTWQVPASRGSGSHRVGMRYCPSCGCENRGVERGGDRHKVPGPAAAAAAARLVFGSDPLSPCALARGWGRTLS